MKSAKAPGNSHRMLSLSRLNRTALCRVLIVIHCISAMGQQDIPLTQRISDWWSHTTKSYLIIAASTPNRDDFPPITFADADAKEMKSFFDTLHYRQLSDHPLVGGDAVFGTVEAALKSIHQGHNDKEVIIVYFSGHGTFGAGPEGQQDVVLILNDGSEQHLTDWVRWARGGKTATDPSYKGQLIFVVDACDSGNGIWRTALTPSELQLPTMILASSTVGQRSLQMLNSNLSAFSWVLRQAVTTDWDQADADHDGFLEYRELKDYAKKSLYQLHKDGKISAEMAPEGNTDQHLFLHYDSSKDKQTDTYDHWQFETSVIAPDELSEAASILSTRADTLVRPSIPTDLAKLLSNIPDNANLSNLNQGYKALALGRFNDALIHFRKVKALHPESPYDIALANTGIARTKLFAGDHRNAELYYESARSYFSDSRVDLLAEAAVNAALDGDFNRAEAYFANANWLEIQDKPGPNEPSPILSVLSRPFRLVTGSRASAGTYDATSLRILQSWAVLSSKKESRETDQILRHSVDLSSRVARSPVRRDQHTAALSLANAATIRSAGGDKKTALKLYKQADDLFDKLGDTSAEYTTMLDGYAQTLKDSNRPAIANMKAEKAERIESQAKETIK